MAKRTLYAFISYSTADKLIGADVKRVLAEFGVDSFLAHDDLRVSEEWKERILQELDRCEIFVPLLSKPFRTSDWAAQETGIVFIRKTVLIIPLSVDGTMPFGFISHLQGKRLPDTGVQHEMFQEPLLRRFPHHTIPQLIKRVEEARSFRLAEAATEPLVGFFPSFSKNEADQFANAAVKNRQVWSASLCQTEYIPAFLAVHKTNVRPKTLKVLAYQIRYNKPFPA